MKNPLVELDGDEVYFSFSQWNRGLRTDLVCGTADDSDNMARDKRQSNMLLCANRRHPLADVLISSYNRERSRLW